jgi:molybdenum cofactor biosynthesis enzyme MoaA
MNFYMVKDLKDIGFYTLSDERAKNVSANSQMMRGEIILTEYCNFRCGYCRGLSDEIYGNRKVKQLSLKEVTNIIDLWCECQPIKNIRFSGGEPTLYPYISDVVAYAKQSGIERIALSTNGSSPMEMYNHLIKLGVNDFSISLDACCADDGDKMAGGVKGSWDIVVRNIAAISKLTYVTVGVVLTPDNIDSTIDTIKFAHELGVQDIRIISSAQWNQPIPRLNEVPEEILDAHPILKYRVAHFAEGVNVRGMAETDSKKCFIVLDDSAVGGLFHFPCIIYMREKGKAIGKVGPNMRNERQSWHNNHDCFNDPICKSNCLDVCRAANNKCRDYKVGIL